MFSLASGTAGATTEPLGAYLIEPFRIYGATGWVEAIGWILLVAAGGFWIARSIRQIDVATLRIPSLIAVVATVPRLVVPHLPFNWWYGVANIPWARNLFSHQTSYNPLPHRLLAFDLGLGFRGLLYFNLAIGVGAILLLFQIARESYGPRVAVALAVLLALIPAYVRISASDAIHLLPFALFACSAYAFAAIGTGRGGWAAHLILFSATALACQIRAEAALMMPSVPLFVGATPAKWREMWAARRRYVAFMIGLAVGGWLMLNHHTHGFAHYLHEAATSDADRSVVAAALLGSLRFLGSLLFRLVLPTNFLPGSYVPAALQLPIWVYTVHCIRRREYREIQAIYLPQAIFSIPAVLAGKESVGFLPEAAYHLIYLVFVALACAKGVVLMHDGWRRWLSTRWRQVIAAIVVAPLLWFDLAVPYFHTYAYEEEFRFLSQRLPSGPATIATIWDPRARHGDYDCCLALPYPPLLAQFPNLRWVVLTADDLTTNRFQAIDFDYYYPGSLSLVAVDRTREFGPKSLIRQPGWRNEDEEHLTSLKRLDASIRDYFALGPWAASEVRANSFSDYRFIDDRMALTIYRRTRP